MLGTRRIRAAAVTTGVIGVLAAVGGVALMSAVKPYPAWVWVPSHLAGVSFTIAGVVLWWYRPDNLTGRLMALVGVTSFLPDLRLCENAVLAGIGHSLAYLSIEVLAHMVLALPSGRLNGRVERVVVATGYVVGLLTQVPRYIVERAQHAGPWIDPNAEHSARSVFALAGGVLNIVVSVVVLWLVLRHWAAAGRHGRQLYSLVWTVAIGLCVLSAVYALAFLIRMRITAPLMAAYSLGLMLTAVAIATGLLRVQLARSRVADLVVRLSSVTDPEDIRDAIARTLEDPTLVVCFRLPDGRHVDAHGAPTALPPPGARSVTPVGAHAVLVHDPGLDEQQSLVEAVVAVARLALENAHLQTVQRAQLHEVGASRARLALAIDDQRRQIQRDLHDGAQHKLLAASMLVARASAQLRTGDDADADGAAALIRASRHLHELVRDMRLFTEGIHPPILAEEGLAVALDALAERAPLPVTVTSVRFRWPELVERTAYFVVAEALTNVYKHADASRAAVRVTGGAHELVVDVTDDGRGGADIHAGTGIGGLRDRVTALGGALTLNDVSTGGTRLQVRLPCG